MMTSGFNHVCFMEYFFHRRRYDRTFERLEALVAELEDGRCRTVSLEAGHFPGKIDWRKGWRRYGWQWL